MSKVDFKYFVPRGENNYIRCVLSGIEFPIDEIKTVNIHLSEDKVTYWLYFSIFDNDEHHRVIFRKNNSPKVVLLIGNNPFEIHGEGKVIETSLHKWENKIEITLNFTVNQASDIVNNPRRENPVSRSEILDL